MAWLVGAVLVVLLAGASISGVHAGGHGLISPFIALALAVGWMMAAAVVGATSGLAWWLAGTSAACSVLALAVTLPALRYRRMTPAAGPEALIGAEGSAVTDLDPVGVVMVRGESWTAESLSGTIPAGVRVHVAGVSGVRLRVWSEVGTVPGAEALAGGPEGGAQ